MMEWQFSDFYYQAGSPGTSNGDWLVAVRYPRFNRYYLTYFFVDLFNLLVTTYLQGLINLSSINSNENQSIPTFFIKSTTRGLIMTAEV